MKQQNSTDDLTLFSTNIFNIELVETFYAKRLRRLIIANAM